MALCLEPMAFATLSSEVWLKVHGLLYSVVFVRRASEFGRPVLQPWFLDDPASGSF